MEKNRGLEKENPNWIYYLLAIWGILNIIQSIFTELDPDEAYYWIYSLELAWGYFDHPPAISVLVKLGSAIIDSELGVRLGIVFCQLGYIYFLWLILDKPTSRKAFLTFTALLVSFPTLQVYGFVATPDGPLLLFTAIFLYLYKRFLVSPKSVGLALLWGISMALLLYSKYHGILVIGFTVLSNLKLFTQKNFYLAGVFGFLLFFPHLYWQYANDFPSFRYHLVGRDDAYELKYTLNYFLNQVINFGPFIFPLAVIAVYKWKNKETFFRTSLFLVIGFILFFFLMSFKGHVEPQWTIAVCFPLSILMYHYAGKHAKFDLWLKRAAIVTFSLVLIIRVLIFIKLPIKANPFLNKVWVDDLAAYAEGNPILMENSYRSASLYAFYTRKPISTFTTITYRRNQFDLREGERDFHNKRTLLLGECKQCVKTSFGNGKTFRQTFVDSLQIFQKVEMYPEVPDLQLKVGYGEKLVIPVKIYNPYDHEIRLAASQVEVQFTYVLDAKDGYYHSQAINEGDLPAIIPASDTIKGSFQFSLPDSLMENTHLSFGMTYDSMPPKVLSGRIRLEIER